MNGYNNGGYMNDRSGLGALSKALIFIVLLVGGLAAAAVIGLTRDPIEDAQAASIMVGVDRQAADLVADMPQMPAISEAEANARIAQIHSEAQTRAVMDDVTRRGIVHNQEHQEAVDAEALDFSQDMHQIVEWLTLGGGVALMTLISLGVAWVSFKEINSRLAVRVAARAAQAATAQLAAAQAVAEARAAAMPPAAPPSAAPSPIPARRAEPVTGRLPDLPTGQPRRERSTPQPQPQPQPDAPALAVHSIPRYPWQEAATLGHGNGAYANGNGHNGSYTNGNGHRR